MKTFSATASGITNWHLVAFRNIPWSDPLRQFVKNYCFSEVESVPSRNLNKASVLHFDRSTSIVGAH